VERYLELAKFVKSRLKKVAALCIDDGVLALAHFPSKGALSPVASKAGPKCLYMVRLARPGLYWAVNTLAREITKWTVACDRRVHRLIIVIYHNQGFSMISYVCDGFRDCKLMLFYNASFASDLRDSKSTSGAVLCLVGPNTFCPISRLRRKQ
jgi:hypothetical protein